MVLLTQAAAGGIGGMLLPFVLLIAMMYFLMIRPQKKEQKRMAAMLASMEVGDSVVTTSGFYGVLIDISDDTVRAGGRCRPSRLAKVTASSPSSGKRETVSSLMHALSAAVDVHTSAAFSMRQCSFGSVPS